MGPRVKKVMDEFGRIVEAYEGTELEMDQEEYGRRMMQQSVLGTSFSVTAHADDAGRVTYRRMNQLRVGVAASAVYAVQGDVEMPLKDFVRHVGKIYTAYEGISIADPDYTYKTQYAKAVIYSYLDRLKSLELVTTLTKYGDRYVRLEPSLGSCAYAMLMDPESTLRSPYVKAMAQSTGGMAVVDKNQAEFTENEVGDLVLERLTSHNILESAKPSWKFALQNIRPLHQSNHVPFYSSDEDDNLVVLPTFPEPGTAIPPSEIPSPVLSPELALEIFGPEDVKRLTSGPNPVLVTVTNPSSGGMVYFYHSDSTIKAYAKHLGVVPSMFTPESSVAIAVFSDLQSKLSAGFDPTKAAHVVQLFLEGDKIKASELGKGIRMQIYVVLSIRHPLVTTNSDGYVCPISKTAKAILRDLVGLCDVQNPAYKPMARVVSEV